MATIAPLLSVLMRRSLQHDFEGKWMAASVDERKKHALVGLSNGCGIAQNLNTSRMYCSKELRLEHLSTNGRVVIDLLTAIAPENLTVVSATRASLSLT